MDNFKNGISFDQMVTNSKTNKTSASGVVGVLFCLVGLILFVGSIVCYFLSIGESSLLMSLLDKILLLIGAGSCLLGVRKLKDGNKEKEYGGQE
jgi:hypothetical protein